MPPNDRRHRERDELQERILSAARELFVKEGYEAVSMRKIAAAIDYTAPALYTHFKDKTELMKELCRRDFAEFDEGLLQLAAIADPVVRILAAGMGYVQNGLKRPHHYRLMFMTPPPPDLKMDPTEVAQFNQPDHSGYALLRQTVKEAVEAGRLRPELKDPEAIAQILWAGVHGIVSLQITHDKDCFISLHPGLQLAHIAILAMTRGLLRDPSEVDHIRLEHLISQPAVAGEEKATS
jgi:AcrR family transcriptional regulator